MTITKFSLLKRLPSLSVDEFSLYWGVPHVKALVEEGGHREYNRSYVQNLLLECCLADGVPVFDGIAQMETREDLPSTRRFQQDPRYMQNVRPDEAKFLDVGQCTVVYCETESITSAPADAHFKFILMHTCDQALVRGELPDLLRQIETSARVGIKHHVIDRSKLTRMSDGSPLQWPYTAMTEIAVDSSELARQLAGDVRAWNKNRKATGNEDSPLPYMTALERVIY